MEIVIGVVLIVLVIGIYVITYVINEKTDVPEGCEDLTDFSACHGCTNSSCGIKQKLEKTNNDK
ncbi:MAG: hypothetical protein JXB20_04690 [Bacilli bacterium]|nr:hypothetical protein [Bacilli bacterium]MBN2696244.1 hypothetical protein [Bacilli bacterium]